VPAMGFEPAIPASEQLQTFALDVMLNTNCSVRYSF